MKLQELDQNEMAEINGGALLNSNLLGGALDLSSLTGLLSGLGGGTSGLSGLTSLLSGLTQGGNLNVGVSVTSDGHGLGLNLGGLLG